MRSLRRCSLLALLPLLSQCTDAPTEPDLESPVLQIVSGAGSPSGHFYFLPPIAAGTGFSGTFDAGLLSQLQVRVCALSSGATPACVGGDIVSFSSSTSPAILLDAVGENYSVNWSTKKNGLSTSINYRIRVFAGSVLLGFADLDVVANKKQLTSVPVGFVGLIKNSSLLIKFRVETGIVGSVVVSPSSATIVPPSTQQFTATVTDLHGANIASPTLLWSSSNTAAATVDQSGLATAVAPGTTTIKAASQGVEGTASLTVQAELQATDDGYTATGNIAIAIADGTADVLNNDQGTGTLTVSEVQGASANVGVATNTTASGIGSITGNVTLNANGSFSYDPPPGYTGTDQFTYRITDGSSASNLATVTITVSDMMWFMCDACGGNNRGTLTHPFTSVADFTAANTGSAPAPQPNHKLYIRSGTYDGAADNLTLRDGQLAFGQAVAAATVFTPDANSVAAYAALTAETAPVIAPSSGNGVNLASGNTLRGFDLGNAAGTAIVGSNFGVLTASDVSINTTQGALDLNTGSASATGVTFGSITSSGGTNNIKLANLGGANAFALGSGALSGASSNAFDVDNGTAPISYSGTIANTTTRPVRIENYDGGTIALSGAVSGSASGVLLNANTGATISFTGGLSLSTGTNAAFTATGGGTVTAIQNNTSIVNTLATTTGTALDVQNTTIGVAGITFRSISANGAPSGIVLNTTGTSGGLTVTGNSSGLCGGSVTSNGATVTAPTASDCTGGSIINSTGPGILLNSTSNFSLEGVRVANSRDDGIRGASVNGLTLTASLIENNGNAVDDRGVDLTNLTGSGDAANVTVRGSANHNIVIENTSGTLSAFNVTNSQIATTNLLVAGTGEDGILFLNSGSGIMTISVTQSAFTDNKNAHFLAASSANASGSLNVTFSNNTLLTTPANDANVVGGGITLVVDGAADMTFAVSGNNIQQAFDAAINVNHAPSSSATGVMSGAISNNTIGTAGDLDSGSESDNTITVAGHGAGPTIVSVAGNTVRQWGNGFGILIQQFEGNGSMDATVTGNSAKNPGTFAINGIHVSAGGTAGPPVDAGTTCVAITGNDVTLSGKVPGVDTDIRLRQRFSTTIRLPGYAGANNDVTAVNAFVSGNNTGSPTVSNANNVGGGGGGFVGGAACSQP